MGLKIPEPIPVGAHIRLFRWCFLIAGVVYGFQRRQELVEIEKVLNVKRVQKRLARERKIAFEKRLTSERDLATLAALAETDDD